jgi:hypothetical protein
LPRVSRAWRIDVERGRVASAQTDDLMLSVMRAWRTDPRITSELHMPGA